MSGRGSRSGAARTATIDARRAAREIDAALREAGDPDRAADEKRYLKSRIRHYGVAVPGIRKVAAAFVKAHPELERRGLLALVQALWADEVHEARMAAVELLDLLGDLLEPTDLALVERLVRESGTWALVDGLAANVAGGLVERHPGLGTTLDRWATDPDFWVRRAALLALLLPLRRGGGDFDRFGRYAEGMLEEREFFVRKAIGWVLRETGKTRPELVHRWLLPRAGRAARLTVREAIKHLPEDLRAEILASRG